MKRTRFLKKALSVLTALAMSFSVVTGTPFIFENDPIMAITAEAATETNGVYQITSKDDLCWFAEHVNGGNQSANAVLTADIDMSGVAWTPICQTVSFHDTETSGTGYSGTFDGNGHTISNLTVTGISGATYSYGLFGTVSGTVKNLGMVNYTYTIGSAPDARAGSVAGQVLTGGTIINCYSVGHSVTTGSKIAGGIAGCNYGGTISNCYALNGTVTGYSDRWGGVVGDSRKDDGATDKAETYGIVSNCYTDDTRVVSSQNDSVSITNCGAVKNDTAFASGEIAYLLNGSSSENVVWYQTLGTDAYPVLDSTSGTVYAGYDVCKALYANSADGLTAEAQPHDWNEGECNYCKRICEHNYVDGVCTVCSMVWTTDITVKLNSGEFAEGEYSYADGVHTISTDKPVIISGTTTTETVVIASGVNANITLAGVNIDVSKTGNACAFKIADDSTGNVTITLADGKTNVLKSGSKCAGLQKNGTTGTLTIEGTGELEARGGSNSSGIGGAYYKAGSNITINGGTVTAIGSSDSAGIGGSARAGSNITINGGTVTATGGSSGAGIGGGGGNKGSGSNITITGGTVTAQGGDYGSGIGGGYNGIGSNITISGGTVTAIGGSRSAGIGGGYNGTGSAIKIKGGSVKVTAGSDANAIGGGYGQSAVKPTNGSEDVYLLEIDNPSGAAIYIDGKEFTPVKHNEENKVYVYLTGKEHTVKLGENAAATYIFIGFSEKFVTASDSDAMDFTVTGGTYGVDYAYIADDTTLYILTGTALTISNKDSISTADDKIAVNSDVSANITLDGVNIDVSGIDNASAFSIADDSTGNVTITLADGKTNVLKSGWYCAGIQKNGTTGTLTIGGTGELEATSYGYGAGIGGGKNKSSTGITINGGTVKAKSGGDRAGVGGGYGAGIGGGYYGAGSNITINGGTVEVKGGIFGGAGIGGGYFGTGSNITINGGTVTAQGDSGGAGIGGGYKGTGSDIKIKGGSVKAIPGSNANAIGGGINQPAVTPTNGSEDVYLLEIDNPSGEKIYIDGEEFTPVKHNSEAKVYVYLTGTMVYTVKVGETETKYVYDSEQAKFVVPMDVSTESFVFTAPNDLVYDGEAKTATVAVKENAAGVGEVTVKYFLVNEDGSLAAVDKAVNAGTYQVKIDVESTDDGVGDYLGLTDSDWKFTIEQADISTAVLTVASENIIYNGKEQKPTCILMFGGTALTVDTDFKLEYSDNINAGTATITATGCNSCKGTVSATFEIAEADISTAVLTVTSENIIYNGEEQKPDCTLKLGETALTVGTDFTLEYSNNINAGVATITATGCNSCKGTVSVTFEIGKADLIFTAPTAVSDLGYTGKPQALVTAGKVENGEMQYSLEENGTYSTTIPTGTNAGTYIVWYKVVVVDKNYKDIAPASVEATIAKAIPTVIAPTATPITYGQKLSDSVLTEGWEWVTPDTIPSVNNTGFAAVKTLIDDNNYDYSQLEGYTYTADTHKLSVLVVVTLNKAGAEVTTAPTPVEKLIYTGEPQALVTAGTATGGEMQYSLEENGTYSLTIPTGTDAKTYTVWYKAVGDEKHNDTAPASVEVTIARKAVKVTADNVSKTYGEDDPELTYTAAGLAGDDTLTGTLTRVTGEDIGEYTITQGTLTNENNPNYEITFVNGTFEIKGIDISEAIVIQSSKLTYDGTAQTPTFTVILDHTTLTDDDYDVTVAAQINAGSYTATITGKGKYSGTIADAAWTIYKRDPYDVVIVSFPTDADGTIFYDGTEKLVTVKTNGVGIGTITVRYYQNGIEVTTPVNAGYYTVVIDIAEGTNYTSGCTERGFRIIGYRPTFTAPTGIADLEYNGSAQELVTAGTATGGTMEYSLDGVNYTTTVPTATNADTYNVYWRVEGDENYEDVDRYPPISVTIAKVDAVLTTTPAAVTGLVYTGQAQALVTAGSTTVGAVEYSLDGTNYSTSIPTATKPGTYTVYYKVTGTDNYTGVAVKIITVKIDRSLTITQQPVDFTGNVGDTATFTVAATGKNLAYQWQQDVGNGWVSINTAAGRKSTFSVTVAAFRNGYKYRCVITDAVGATEISNAVTLSITKLEITKQPVDFTGEIGETASFTVAATGANITYQWQQDTGNGWLDMNSSAARKETFSIAVTELRDGYKYRCVIKDTNGQSVTSDAVTLRILKPEITEQPVDFTGEIGETATFTVTATGKNLTYQWYQNTGSGWAAINTAAGRSSKFSVQMAAFRVGFKYYCAVSDGTTIVNSDEVTLKLAEVLEITTQPADFVGNIGDTAKFTVEATGATSYQWYQNTGSGWVAMNTTAGRSKSISIAVAQFRVGFQYKCEISDGTNTITSNTVSIKLDEVLGIKTQPTDYVGAIGDTAKFTITATGVKYYQWQQNTGSGWVNINTSAGRSNSISIAVAEFRVGYQYRCMISDGTTLIASDVVAIRLAGETLAITGQPEDFVGTIGENATFTVTATGATSYQWYQNTGSGWVAINTTAGRSDTITIPVAAFRVGFQYRCEVSDGTNTITSEIAELLI